MKTQKIFQFIIFISIFLQPSYGQEIVKGKGFEVDGINYVFVDEYTIANKNNKLMEYKIATHDVDSYEHIDVEMFKDLTKSFFTKERSEDFSYMDLFTMCFYCDSTGQIKEVYFSLIFENDSIRITPKEIRKIEKKMLNLKTGLTPSSASRKASYYEGCWGFPIRSLYDKNYNKNRMKYMKEKNIKY